MSWPWKIGLLKWLILFLQCLFLGGGGALHRFRPPSRFRVKVHFKIFTFDRWHGSESEAHWDLYTIVICFMFSLKMSKLKTLNTASILFKASFFVIKIWTATIMFLERVMVSERKEAWKTYDLLSEHTKRKLISWYYVYHTKD